MSRNFTNVARTYVIVTRSGSVYEIDLVRHGRMNLVRRNEHGNIEVCPLIAAGTLESRGTRLRLLLENGDDIVTSPIERQSSWANPLRTCGHALRDNCVCLSEVLPEATAEQLPVFVEPGKRWVIAHSLAGEAVVFDIVEERVYRFDADFTCVKKGYGRWGAYGPVTGRAFSYHIDGEVLGLVTMSVEYSHISPFAHI